MLKALLFTIALSSILYAQEGLDRIAVLPFNNTDNTLTSPEVLVLSTKFQGLVKEKTRTLYQVMTQENIEALLPEGAVLEDCIGMCQLQIGRTLQSHLTISGQLYLVNGKKRLIIQMYDTKQGSLLAQAETEGLSLLEIEHNLDTVSKTLVDSGLQALQGKDIEADSKLLEAAERIQESHSKKIEKDWKTVVSIASASINESSYDTAIPVVEGFISRYQDDPLASAFIQKAESALTNLRPLKKAYDLKLIRDRIGLHKDTDYVKLKNQLKPQDSLRIKQPVSHEELYEE